MTEVKLTLECRHTKLIVSHKIISGTRAYEIDKIWCFIMSSNEKRRAVKQKS